MKIESSPNGFSLLTPENRFIISFPPAFGWQQLWRSGGRGKQIVNFILLCLCFWHTDSKAQLGIAHLPAAWGSSAGVMGNSLSRTN